VLVLKKNRNVMVEVADPMGNYGVLLFNHLYPPFNDVRARRAILMAVSQEDYMLAIVGNDDSLWKPTRGFFTQGTPLYNEEGGEVLKGPRNFDAAKRLLAESGYAGEPVTCLVAQDISVLNAFGEVTADLIKRLGMNVDYAALDWGTTVARRAQKSPSGRSGWLSPVWAPGANGLNPATNGLRHEPRLAEQSAGRGRDCVLARHENRSTRKRPSRAGSTRPRSNLCDLRAARQFLELS
jgi:peptide/nickel transport system substrate-binding protein